MGQSAAHYRNTGCIRFNSGLIWDDYSIWDADARDQVCPSDVVSIMDALQPIVTAILSVIFFKEWMNWIEILGIVLVILAIYILQNGRRKGYLETID